MPQLKYTLLPDDLENHHELGDIITDDLGNLITVTDGGCFRSRRTD